MGTRFSVAADAQRAQLDLSDRALWILIGDPSLDVHQARRNAAATRRTAGKIVSKLNVEAIAIPITEILKSGGTPILGACPALERASIEMF